MLEKSHNKIHAGALYALAAYGFWGFVPIFWKFIDEIPAWETMAHRGIWSLLFLLVFVFFTDHWHVVKNELRSPARIAIFVFTSVLISFNWFLYIWAIQTERLVEASLGYFINPLFNVLLGVVILNESLTMRQKLAVGLAVAGVLNQTIIVGRFPWIALALAGTFSIYGLVRRQVQVDAVPGLTIEVMIIFLPALMFLFYLQHQQQAVFLNVSVTTNLLLPFTGLVTALPLLWMVKAAKRLRYSTLGFFQYLAPSLNFLLAIFLFNEYFDRQQLVTFVCIWLALTIYLMDSISLRNNEIDA